MKGFKDSDGKFRPISNSKGIRKRRLKGKLVDPNIGVAIDTITGRKFPFNSTVTQRGIKVPARETTEDRTFLAEGRVDKETLRKLNPDKRFKRDSGLQKIMFTNKEEELKHNDFGKHQIPADKIRITDRSRGLEEEQFEMVTSFKNKEDAKLFVKTYNEIEERILGIKTPMVVKRFVQNGVFYDIYQDRWRTMKDGKLVEFDIGEKILDDPDRILIPREKWQEFKAEVKRVIPEKIFT